MLFPFHTQTLVKLSGAEHVALARTGGTHYSIPKQQSAPIRLNGVMARTESNCPLMKKMADFPPSSAALAVFWEFNRAASGKPDDWHYLPAIAAALRAAADQVVPEQLENFGIRYELLRIATELEDFDG